MAIPTASCGMTPATGAGQGTQLVTGALLDRLSESNRFLALTHRDDPRPCRRPGILCEHLRVVLPRDKQLHVNHRLLLHIEGIHPMPLPTIGGGSST